MPTALNRLLARPSTLRILRTLINGPELLTAVSPSSLCSFSTIANCWDESKAELPKPSHVNDEPLDSGAPHRRYSRNVNTVNVGTELRSSIWPRIDMRRGREKDRFLARAVARMERVYGTNDINHMWLGIARRRYNLPIVDSQDAHLLWSTFLKQPTLVLPVIEHAAHIWETTGKLYPKLYLVCMEHWLLRDPDKALDLHHKLVLTLELRELPLRELARHIRHNPKALESFMDIYRTSNERNVYDEIVPALCDHGDISVARWWHTICIRRRDLPSLTVESHPYVSLFLAEFSPVSLDQTLHDQDTAQDDISSQNHNPKYNLDLKRKLLRRHTAAVRFDDSFCAKLFATKAFHPSSIIQGLVMAGVNEIGPLALRVLGLRTEPLSELSDRFQELKNAGIALQGCVFSLALEKFASEGKEHLVRSMLESDQHPDVFDNGEVQVKLLDYYLEKGDWMQAHRTLAILALFDNNIAHESWNILLRAHIRNFDQNQFTNLLREMLSNQVRVSYDSIQAIKGLLRPRRRGHRPQPSPGTNYDDLRFVTQVYIMILQSGSAYILPKTWTEILRRYGMVGRVRELRRLIFWLLTWYAPRNGTEFSKLPKPTFLNSATKKLAKEHRNPLFYWKFPNSKTQQNKLHPIRQLFPPTFLQGLVAWGFHAALLPHAPLEQSLFGSPADNKQYKKNFKEKGLLARVHWSWGLELVAELRDFGVHVHPHTVIKTLQLKLINIFGNARSNLVANRMMQRANKTEYAEYLRKINEVWGGPLFQLSPNFGTSNGHSMGIIWHPKMRKRFINRDPTIEEILGQDWRRPITEQKNYTKDADNRQGEESINDLDMSDLEAGLGFLDFDVNEMKVKDTLITPQSGSDLSERIFKMQLKLTTRKERGGTNTKLPVTNPRSGKI